MNEVVKVKVAQFDRDMQLILGDNYLDTIIYGSNSLDDFHIGKSDIDFCVVVQNDLSDSEIEKIINLHEVYRNRNDIEIAFFEGYYYPSYLVLFFIFVIPFLNIDLLIAPASMRYHFPNLSSIGLPSAKGY